MRSYFLRIIWVGFVTAITIIAWLGITSYRNNNITRETATWVSHANTVLYHSEEILSLTVDLESGQRGFALTGKEEFLEPSIDASKRLMTHIETLKSLTFDNQRQQDRLANLETLIREKVEFTLKAIDARRHDGLKGALDMNATMIGKHLTDRIRKLIREVQYEENQLLEQRRQIVDHRVGRFNNYFVGMLFTTGVILLLLFYFIYVNLKARTQAENSLRLASEKIHDIYNNAPCGYHSLDERGVFIEINNTWLQWLKYARHDVVNRMTFDQILSPESAAKFNATFPAFKSQGTIRDEEFTVMRKDGSMFPVLMNAVAFYDEENRYLKSRSTVIDYTEQKKALERIEQLNHELESFSYSVSHDLRAPLRSIDGYTQILIEDYSGKLDAEGRRVLQVVVHNARRMAKLIDDLLDFSRVGRKEISRSLVNTDALVQSVLSELTPAEQNRKIDVRLRPLSSSFGDPNLLRQVWINLISNALKYTRKSDEAVIEISSAQGPDEVVFSIKDNGTGFDMQYAGKLFGVFQRLHRQNDFEGTGVGLAIVHRIVSRHGGRVWAEAEPGKGATFYFSLPAEQQS